MASPTSRDLSDIEWVRKKARKILSLYVHTMFQEKLSSKSAVIFHMSPTAVTAVFVLIGYLNFRLFQKKTSISRYPFNDELLTNESFSRDCLLTQNRNCSNANGDVPEGCSGTFSFDCDVTSSNKAVMFLSNFSKSMIMCNGCRHSEQLA